MTRYAKLRHTLCTLLATLWMHTAPLDADGPDSPLTVEHLSIEAGNSHVSSFDESAVRARLKTKEGDFFSQTYFDEDLKALASEYHRVVPVVEFKEDRVIIKLKVWPKPLIRTIRFEGNERMATKDLQSELGIQPQTIFDRKKFTEAFHKLQTHYVKKGYFEAEVQHEVLSVEDSNEIDIIIRIEEGRAGKIQKILFLQFTREEETDLSKMILTKKFNFIRSFLTEDGIYHPEKVEQDRLFITDYLHNRGYPDAQVHIRTRDAASKGRILLEIEADKGELYHFGRVSFEGNQLFDDTEIQKLLTIQEGSAFSPKKLREASQAIQLLYGRKGYVDAFITYEPRLNPETLTYDVHFCITESERYRVGLIKVFGNTCTETSVILHETLLIPGDVFNLDKLRSTERRLLNIGYFEHVNVYAVKSTEAEIMGGEFRDIHIEVQEQSTGSFNFSAGYSTTDSIFGSFALTEKNFCIRRLPCIFQDGYQAVRGGGEYFYSRVSFGEKTKNFYSSWAKPHFNDTSWTVGVDFDSGINRAKAKDYDTQHYGGSVFGKYTINQFLRTGLHYRVRRSIVSDIPKDASLMLQAERANAGVVSAIGASLVYNSTNHPVCPTQGLRSELFTEYAGLGGKHEFWSIAYLNTLYVPVWNYLPHPGCLPLCLYDGVLKFRGDLRFKQPLGDSKADTLPIDERFFLGGDGTVRGYRPYSIGPQFTEGDPMGGISSVLYSIEYNQPLFACLDTFLFLDGGHVSQKEWRMGRFNSAYGFGARITFSQSMPPLTLGLGFPIDLDRPKDKNSFFFALGGHF